MLNQTVPLAKHPKDILDLRIFCKNELLSLQCSKILNKQGQIIRLHATQAKIQAHLFTLILQSLFIFNCQRHLCPRMNPRTNAFDEFLVLLSYQQSILLSF